MISFYFFIKNFLIKLYKQFFITTICVCKMFVFFFFFLNWCSKQSLFGRYVEPLTFVTFIIFFLFWQNRYSHCDRVQNKENGKFKSAHDRRSFTFSLHDVVLNCKKSLRAISRGTRLSKFRIYKMWRKTIYRLLKCFYPLPAIFSLP